MTRDEAIKRIRDGLKKRSGKSWSVCGGRGSAWGWIDIKSPPKRRKTSDTMTDVEREELGSLLNKGGPTLSQGVSIPSSDEYYREYVARAEGQTPDVYGKPYWD
jgi:hypothetical protein